MFAASTTVTHATFSGNGATTGADIRRSSGTLTLRNSILANSTAGANCVGSLAVNTNNLIEDGTCSPALSGDPLLSTLGDYGGTTQTFALRPGSPAIDAGSSAACLATDQRGLSRAVGASCDSGAVEFQGYTLTISGGNSQTTAADSAFATPLAVALTSIDTNETANAGNSVSFTAPASGAGLNPASLTATTDASGVASAAVVANSIAGSYVVTATATGVAVPATFNLTNCGNAITVPAGDSAALIMAITCANINADANVINLTNSTYTFTSASDIDATWGDNALPRITTPITITGNGAIIERAIGAPEFRLLDIEGGTVILDHLTLSGGHSGLGGGIRNVGDLTLRQSTVISNTGDDGGGIRNEGALTVIDSTIANNSAGGVGGGIDNTNNVTIAGSTIINNTAGGGAGIRNEAGATVTNSTITNNTAASFGGGIANSGGLTLSDSTLSGNRVTASSAGGGGLINSNTATVINSTISGNSVAGNGEGGGGIRHAFGVLTLTNSVISGNSAPNGGGMDIIGDPSATALLTNATVAGNSAESAGGGILLDAGTLTVRNSIIWGNRVGAAVSSIANANSTPVVSYSLVEGGYSGAGNLSSDPQFISPVASTAAPTTSGDYHLQADSPALNVGNTAALPVDDDDLDSDSNTAEAIPYDRDGNARVVNGIVDLGAYEYQPTNQPPALAQPLDLTILEDAGAQTVNLSGISAGTGESQTLSISAVSSNPALIPNPSVSYTSPSATGGLSFTPAADAGGSATITVTVQDSGGTNGGGMDTLTRSFSVTVTPVNDAPSFTAGPNQSVDAGAGAQTVADWASGFTSGPADEAVQTLLGYSVVSNMAPDLFTVAPTIDAAGVLTYTPTPGARGTATISVVVRDSGGTADGGVDTSAIHMFTITIGGSYQVYLPLLLGA